MFTVNNAQDIPSTSRLIFLWNDNSDFYKLFSSSVKNLEACDQSFYLHYYIMYFTAGETEIKSFEGKYGLSGKWNFII